MNYQMHSEFGFPTEHKCFSAFRKSKFPRCGPTYSLKSPRKFKWSTQKSPLESPGELTRHPSGCYEARFPERREVAWDEGQHSLLFLPWGMWERPAENDGPTGTQGSSTCRDVRGWGSQNHFWLLKGLLPKWGSESPKSYFLASRENWKLTNSLKHWNPALYQLNSRLENSDLSYFSCLPENKIKSSLGDEHIS